MIMHYENGDNSNGNITHTITTNTNSSKLFYWEYAITHLPQLPSVAIPKVASSTQNLYPAIQPDNHTQAQTGPQPPPFYTSFNISDDLFDYFNGFVVDTTATEQQPFTTTQVTTTTGTTTFLTYNTTTARDLGLYECLINLPKDRLSLLLFLILFSFVTVFGNSLVILAVIRERYLHTATNYFITSLAVADCLVGLVVMPFSAIYEVFDNTWFFGEDWCDIWRSLDVLFSTASILNLCVISLDRYWAITDPFSYPMRMTVKRAAALICGVWVCSSGISFPAIVWWRAAREGDMPAYKCTFTEHLGYLVFSSTISFYLPLLVMVFTYCRIYRAAVIQTRSLKIGTKQVLMSSGELQLTLRIHRGGTTREPSTSSSSQHHSAQHGGGSLGGGGGAGSQHHHSHSHHHSSHHNHSTAGTTTSTPEEPDDEPLSALQNNGLARHRHMGKNFSLSRKLAKFAKEKKAAKTLGIVMGVFIVCWLPFFVVNLLSGFCIECIEHEEIVSAIVTWLGWINSCMNPVIYACWSRDFRRAFVRLLCMCCPREVRRRYQPTMRSKSQLSSCSSCSGSSSCGQSGMHHHHHHHHSHLHHRPQQQPQQHHQEYQQQQMYQERERTCTRCQSFHRHNHRQRRRSSEMHHHLRNDFNGAAPVAMSNTTQAIVTITPAPTSLLMPILSTTVASSYSTLTISSVPSNMMLDTRSTIPTAGSTSAVTRPGDASAPTAKHCSFTLSPSSVTLSPPPVSSPNQNSFLEIARFHSNICPPEATHHVKFLSTASAPSLIEAAMEMRASDDAHRTLEMRQSAQSQITTLEDVDDDSKGDMAEEQSSNSSSFSLPIQ